MDTPEDLASISTYADVEQLVRNGVPEDLHLEYKSGRPKDINPFKEDIAQDISAFANSDGGTLIIGVTEMDNHQIQIDGIDDKKLSREQVGQVVATKIRPIIPGLRIFPMPGPQDESVLVISVPRSDEAPHQGSNHKYYRRYEHHNQPLAHHEIEDLRRRRISLTPLVVVSTATRGGVLTAVDVRNAGEYPANDITFTLSSTRIWPDGAIPTQFITGIKHLGPSQRLRFRGETSAKLFANPEAPATFTVRVEYTHSWLQKRMSHVWPLDFEAYRNSMVIFSDKQQDRRDAKDELKKIRESLAEFTGCVKEYFPKLVGANGLDLSVYSLRNLGRIAAGGPIEKLSPRHFNTSGFQTALNIDVDLAYALEGLFRHQVAGPEEISQLPGMTQEILERFKQTFQLDDREPESGTQA
jgi:Schlafen, AlbA_2